MNRHGESLPGAPVVPWPAGEPAPGLPGGKAGISVRIRTKAIDPSYYKGPRTVGVDDRPMWQGLGRMVIVTEPGEHLVEVRGRFSAETARLVRVRAGEIAELEYWTPVSRGPVDGVLVQAPARRRMGSGGWGVLAGLLAMTCVMLVAETTGDQRSTAVFAVFAALLFITPVAVIVMWHLVKRRVDRRYRAAVSYEADADARAADIGMFLGDGDSPPGLADGNRGVLVITGTAWREYVWNGTQVAAQPAADPNSWLPWPSLIIDGAEHPFSWRTWCYRLPPGEHKVTVTAPPPPGPGPDRDRPAAEPVTMTVDIAAGRVTRLDLRVKAKIEVRSTQRNRRTPTEVIRFEAAVDVRASAPVAPGR